MSSHGIPEEAWEYADQCWDSRFEARDWLDDEHEYTYEELEIIDALRDLYDATEPDPEAVEEGKRRMLDRAKETYERDVEDNV